MGVEDHPHSYSQRTDCRMTQPNDLTLQYSRIIADLRDKVKLLEEKCECQERGLWDLAELYAEGMLERARVEDPDFFNDFSGV